MTSAWAGRPHTGQAAAVLLPRGMQDLRASSLPAKPTTHALPLPRVRVRNVYFEPTPLELLSGVVTERGLLDVSTVKEAVEALTQKYILAFQLPMKD